MRRALLAGFLLPFSTATAQGWNSDAALTLVRRAILRCMDGWILPGVAMRR